MGLDVQVGMLAYLLKNDKDSVEYFRNSIAKINEVLREKGLTEHKEPEELPKIESRCGIIGYPYSFLHYLRRFYAHVVNDPDWNPTPVPEGEDPTEDPVYEDESYMISSHLVCHSDCEGYYFPIELEDMVIDTKDKDRIPGGLLCSSYSLLEELVLIAPKLDIQLDNGVLTDAEADKINKKMESEEGLWIEKIVWLSLFEAARLSIEHKAAICFV